MFETYSLGIAFGAALNGQQHAALYAFGKSRHATTGTLFFAKYEPSLQRFCPESDDISKFDFRNHRAPGFVGAFMQKHLRDISRAQLTEVQGVFRRMERAASTSSQGYRSSHAFIHAFAHQLDVEHVAKHSSNYSYAQQVNYAIGPEGFQNQSQGLAMRPYMNPMGQMGPQMPAYNPQMVPMVTPTNYMVGGNGMFGGRPYHRQYHRHHHHGSCNIM